MPQQKRETKRRSTGRTGRPTKYDPAFCEKAVEHFKEGGSVTTLGAALGVGRNVVFGWQKRHPAFREACEYGVELSELWWANLGRDMSCGVNRDGNVAAWVFNMKNRFGWRDKQELSGDKDQPVTVSIVKFGSKDSA